MSHKEHRPHRVVQSPEQLHIRVIAGDVTRPNLKLEVFYARNGDEKLRHLLAFCQSEPGSGIVYAGTRARCEELAALLRRYDVAAGHYHAGIADRDRAQDDFMAGRVRVVVATIAFSFVVSFVLFKGIDLVMGLRPSEEDEEVGLDQSEHAETGYVL